MPYRFLAAWTLRLAIPAVFIMVIVQLQGYLRDFASMQRQLSEYNFAFFESALHWRGLQGVTANADMAFLDDESLYPALVRRASLDRQNFSRFGHVFDMPDDELVNTFRKSSQGCLVNATCQEQIKWFRTSVEREDHFEASNSEFPSSGLLDHLRNLQESVIQSFYEDWLIANEDLTQEEADKRWHDPILIGSGHFAEVWRSETMNILKQAGVNYHLHSLAEFPGLTELTDRLINGVFYRGRFAKDVVFDDQLSEFLDMPEIRTTPLSLSWPIFVAGDDSAIKRQMDLSSYESSDKIVWLTSEDISGNDHEVIPATICRVDDFNVICDQHFASRVIIVTGQVSKVSDELQEHLTRRLQLASEEGKKVVFWDLSIEQSLETLQRFAENFPAMRLILVSAWHELALVPWELTSVLEQLPSASLLLNPGSTHQGVQKLVLSLAWYKSFWNDWFDKHSERLIAGQWLAAMMPVSLSYTANSDRILNHWLTEKTFDASVFHERGYNELHEPGLYLRDVPGLALSPEAFAHQQNKWLELMR